MERRRSEANGGAIDASGHDTAPSSPGVFHVRATSATDPSIFAEATVTVPSSLTEVTLVSSVSDANATGHGSQTHLFRTPDARWWLFYPLAGTQQLSTAVSRDFVSWTPGDSTDGTNAAVIWTEPTAPSGYAIRGVVLP